VTGDAAPEGLRVLVVDDERPARRKLLRLLAAAPGVERVFEASSGGLAAEVIDEQEPDLVFLDVRMPGMDGFQLLETLPQGDVPQVIFVTAYDEHAVRAFQVHAVDYLLKPFDEVRFRQALERARARVTASRTREERREVGHLLATLRQALGGERPERLLVTSRPGRKVPLLLERVRRVEMDRNEALFHADGRIYRLRTTLNELEEKLGSDRFLRINRSEMVSLARIVELEPLDHGDVRVHLDDGDVRRMSRRYRDRIDRLR
jgi:two-component system, LytTR family, response regulator